MSTDTTAHSGHSMGEMGTFHWGTAGDGLWIDTWIPKSEGAYIGACFGILIIAIISRALPALEAYVIAWRVLQDDSLDTHNKQDLEKPPSSSTLYPLPASLPVVPAFSWKPDTLRSLLSTLTSFFGYLLMMVVMTGNGGFFFVIVGGIFIGEMAFGRFKTLGGIHNDHGH